MELRKMAADTYDCSPMRTAEQKIKSCKKETKRKEMQG